MNGDEASRIVGEVASLKAMLVEREHGASEFRSEVRTGLRETVDAIKEHTSEDTRRFEKVDASLDEKVSGLYEHLQKQADVQRTRAWQILSIALAAFFGVVTAFFAAHRSGLW